MLLHPLDVLLPVLLRLGHKGRIRRLHPGQQDLGALGLDSGGQGEVLLALVAQQDIQDSLRIRLEIVKALSAGAQEGAQGLGLLLDHLIIGQEDKLIKIGHAIVGQLEPGDIKALFLHLGNLVVDKASDRGIDLAGRHGAHQIKTDILQVHALGILPYILHDRLDHGLGEGGPAVADGLADKVFGAVNILLLEREDHIQRCLAHGADGLDPRPLVDHGLDRILLVEETDLGAAGGDQGDRVVVICGEADLHIQPLLLKIALFDGIIEKGMDRVGIPVEDHVHLAKLFVLTCSRLILLAGGLAFPCVLRTGGLSSCIPGGSALPGSSLSGCPGGSPRGAARSAAASG